MSSTSSSERKRKLLKNHYLFSDVEQSVVDRVADLGVTRSLAPGEHLFFKGDEGDALYGMFSGKLCIVTGSVSGREVILNVMEEGDIFGEIALLDGLPRTADARALEACELLMIRRRDFLPLLSREPTLSLHLIELLCERIRWNCNLIEDSAFLDFKARLAKRLLGLGTAYGFWEDEGLRIGLKLSQKDLGHMLGTTRESINRQLKDWVRSGWISHDRGRIIIKDMKALQRLVDEALNSQAA